MGGNGVVRDRQPQGDFPGGNGASGWEATACFLRQGSSSLGYCLCEGTFTRLLGPDILVSLAHQRPGWRGGPSWTRSRGLGISPILELQSLGFPPPPSREPPNHPACYRYCPSPNLACVKVLSIAPAPHFRQSKTKNTSLLEKISF